MKLIEGRDTPQYLHFFKKEAPSSRIMEDSAVVRMVMLLVFVGWLMMWVMLPTETYKFSWKPTLANRLDSTYFREQGFLIYIHVYLCVCMFVLSVVRILLL